LDFIKKVWNSDKPDAKEKENQKKKHNFSQQQL
jgi:hypothetical protein